MRFKDRLLAFFMTSVLSLVVKSCRVQISGLAHFHKALENGSSILSFWHDGMAMIPPIFGAYCKKTNFIACVSKSRDGDLLEAFIKYFPPTKCIRIGHLSRASGFLEMIREAEKGNTTLLITPDGPKGPRRDLKKGVLELSAKTGIPILTVAWTSSSTFSLPTWDQFRIPRPFSRIEMKISLAEATEESVTSGMNLI